MLTGIVYMLKYDTIGMHMNVFSKPQLLHAVSFNSTNTGLSLPLVA